MYMQAHMQAQKQKQKTNKYTHQHTKYTHHHTKYTVCTHQIYPLTHPNAPERSARGPQPCIVIIAMVIALDFEDGGLGDMSNAGHSTGAHGKEHGERESYGQHGRKYLQVRSTGIQSKRGKSL